jgi:amidase
MAGKGAIKTAEAIARGETSARAEAEAAIARIEAADGAINAVVVRDFERALAAADAVDARLRRGERGPLLGVPMTVKESFNVAGLPTTWGFTEHKDYVASEDAVAVHRLKRAGAVILGKTNVPVGLADHQAVNPIYGRTSNPHLLDRSAGGSSGGSAAALSSGMVPLELGSDIGGSIRVPAAFNGVWGHKPTYGALDGDGHYFPRMDGAIPPMAVIGPLARNADDLVLALDLLADQPLPRAKERAPGDWRIFLMTAHPVAPVASCVVERLETIGAGLEAAGAKVDRTSPLLPDLGAQFADYMRFLMVAITRGMPREGQAPPTLGEWLAMIDQQARAIRSWTAFFGTYDAVIAPIFGTTAYPHDDRPMDQRVLTIDGRPSPNGLQLAWPALGNYTNLPGTSVPVGHDVDGLPIGVQVLTDRWRDHDAIAIARWVHRLAAA